jgi:hypothetical protein
MALGILANAVLSVDNIDISLAESNSGPAIILVLAVRAADNISHAVSHRLIWFALDNYPNVCVQPHL